MSQTAIGTRPILGLKIIKDGIAVRNNPEPFADRHCRSRLALPDRHIAPAIPRSQSRCHGFASSRPALPAAPECARDAPRSPERLCS